MEVVPKMARGVRQGGSDAGQSRKRTVGFPLEPLLRLRLLEAPLPVSLLLFPLNVKTLLSELLGLKAYYYYRKITKATTASIQLLLLSCFCANFSL